MATLASAEFLGDWGTNEYKSATNCAGLPSWWRKWFSWSCIKTFGCDDKTSRRKVVAHFDLLIIASIFFIKNKNGSSRKLFTNRSQLKYRSIIYFRFLLCIYEQEKKRRYTYMCISITKLCSNSSIFEIFMKTYCHRSKMNISLVWEWILKCVPLVWYHRSTNKANTIYTIVRKDYPLFFLW